MLIRRRALLVLPILAIALGGSYFGLHEYVRAAAFVVSAAGMQGVAASAARLEQDPVAVTLVEVLDVDHAPRFRNSRQAFWIISRCSRSL